MAIGVSWDHPPAREAVSERELFTGYRNAVPYEPEPIVVRSEPCACGGVIRIAFDAPAVIMTAVQAHQRTVQHLAWRAALEATR